MHPSRTTKGIWLLGVFVFVLVAMPKANLKFGPVPIYLADVLLFLLLLSAPPLSGRRAGKPLFAGTVITIAVLAIVSEMVGVMRFGTLLDSAYVAGRTVLSISVFFIVWRYVRSVYDLEVLLKAAVAGLLVTALLMILTSLPMTRSQVSELVFTKKFLEPAADSVSGILIDAPERGVRGRTLVGVSIIGASFINACWPLAALLLRWPGRIALWRSIALAACILAPLGVLFSYSRGPIIASIILVAAAILLGLRHVRRGIVVPVMVGVAIVGSVGIGSQLFYFERLERSTQAIFDNPQEQQSESERLLAYSQPFEHMLDNPSFLIVGEGVAVRYSGAGYLAEQSGQATHAIFAMAYYSYGFVAAFLYLTLLVRALLHSGRIALLHSRTFNGLVAQAVFLSVLAVIPWSMLGHAPVSTPRGAMLLFLIIGLTSIITRIELPRRVPRPTRPRYVHRPHLAVR